MKKRIVIFVMLIFLTLFYGCNNQPVNRNKPTTDDKLYTITIPESYYTYTGTDPSEDSKTSKELGDAYCTDAIVSGKNLIIKVTDTQRKNLIKRNNDYIDKLVGQLLDINSKYKYTGDDEYKELSFYIDENLPANVHLKTIYGTAIGYGLNYILENNSTDWSVHLTIYNYHTGKKVAEGNLPQDTISYGAEEWKKSYD